MTFEFLLKVLITFCYCSAAPPDWLIEKISTKVSDILVQMLYKDVSDTLNYHDHVKTDYIGKGSALQSISLC